MQESKDTKAVSNKSYFSKLHPELKEINVDFTH